MVLLAAAAGTIPGRAADPVSPADPARAASAEPAPIPVPLIETSRSELVLIEVYARDSKGRPVRDLKASDFTLRIDHEQKPRPINTLDWIEPIGPVAPPAGQVAEAEGTAPVQPAPAADSLAAHRNRPRRFLIFFEDSTSAPQQMTAARNAAIKFLERPGLPGDQFGLASYSEKKKIEILQEFTTDKEALRRALEKSAADTTRYTDYSRERIERREQIERVTKEEEQSSTTPYSSRRTGLGKNSDQLKRTYATEDSSRMGRVLNIMKVLTDLLAPWPGYKAIVFIGEGVPENPGNDFGLNDPRLAISSELGGLAQAAGGANVTLHSIQVSGLVAGDAQQVGAAVRRSSALATLALDTGGVSVTSNDLGGAFDTVDQSSQGYYLLTYVPEGPADGNYHSVALKVARRDVTIRYRRGFVRYTPEEARTRALQAAYVAPEMHQELGLDLAVVAGPRAGNDRVVDLVIYVPPRRLLFLPQAGGPAARVEVGIVAYDSGGSETFRLARRLRVTPDQATLAGAAASGLDLFTRVRLPDRAQTITAVVSDLQSGDLGSTKVVVEKSPAGVAGGAGGAQGLSLYAPREKSLWIEIGAGGSGTGAAGAGKPDPTAEVEAGVTVGPALRTRFVPGESIAFGFRPGAASGDAAAEMRLVVRRGEEVVRTLSFAALPSVGGAGAPGGPVAAAGSATLHADLATNGLADGNYVASVETTLDGQTMELGRMPFRIIPRGRA